MINEQLNSRMRRREIYRRREGGTVPFNLQDERMLRKDA
jgi:hypothetical protein